MQSLESETAHDLGQSLRTAYSDELQRAGFALIHPPVHPGGFYLWRWGGRMPSSMAEITAQSWGDAMLPYRLHETVNARTGTHGDPLLHREAVEERLRIARHIAHAEAVRWKHQIEEIIHASRPTTVEWEAWCWLLWH